MKKYNFLLSQVLIATLFDGCEVCSDAETFEDFPIVDLSDATSAKGGYKGFLLVKCNVPIATFDQATIQNLLDTGDALLRLSCNYIGGVRAIDEETENLGDCGAEQVTNRTHTITLSDYANNENLDIDILYQFLQEFPNKYKVYFVTCKNVLEGGFKANIRPNYQNEGGDGNCFWQTVFVWERLKTETRVQADFIDNLTGNLVISG